MSAAAMLALPLTASAAVTVTGLTSFDAATSRFTYNYSVSNTGTDEEIIKVTFPVSTSANLLGITAPTGFKLTYDTVLSLVNFVWGDDPFIMPTFAPNSTVSGFSFTSPDAPGPVTFTADAFSGEFNGTTVSPTAVPEPGALMLGLLAPLALFRRRRGA